MFQNSTGSSSTTSLTLQDHTLPVAWFSNVAESVCHAQFGQFCIWVPI